MNSNMQSITMNDGTVVEFDIGIDPENLLIGEYEDVE
jgi:hypothetical protein